MTGLRGFFKIVKKHTLHSDWTFIQRHKMLIFVPSTVEGHVYTHDVFQMSSRSIVMKE